MVELFYASLLLHPHKVFRGPPLFVKRPDEIYNLLLGPFFSPNSIGKLLFMFNISLYQLDFEF